MRVKRCLILTGLSNHSRPRRLVLFVIRTAGDPLKSHPSLSLAITTLAVVIVGIVLPYSPLAGLLGFTAAPGAVLYLPNLFHGDIPSPG
jgi:hypothetical protein